MNVIVITKAMDVALRINGITLIYAHVWIISLFAAIEKELNQHVWIWKNLTNALVSAK